VDDINGWFQMKPTHQSRILLNVHAIAILVVTGVTFKLYKYSRKIYVGNFVSFVFIARQHTDARY